MKIIEKPKLTDQFFCPLCMTLFLEKNNYVFNDKWNEYKCSFCNEIFREKDYNNKIRRKGQNYKVRDEVFFDVSTEIRKIILNFWKKGYSNRKIHDLTKFSRTRIQNETALKNMIKITLSKKDFFIDYLKIKNINYNLLTSDPTFFSDILIDAIRKALIFGCSKKQVSNLFNVSHRVIHRARNEEYDVISRFLRLNKENQDKEIESLNNTIKDYADKINEKDLKYNRIKILDGKIEVVLVDNVKLD